MNNTKTIHKVSDLVMGGYELGYISEANPENDVYYVSWFDGVEGTYRSRSISQFKDRLKQYLEES